jgi:hypothetical protein
MNNFSESYGYGSNLLPYPVFTFFAANVTVIDRLYSISFQKRIKIINYVVYFYDDFISRK